ncbi:MAG: hypothetical protein L0211_01315 [Planctomycetaceae bacterium]|nr:hypothetical protein [Planctomycetaceae bacterium]
MPSQPFKSDTIKLLRSPAAFAAIVWLLAALLALPQGVLSSRPAAPMPGLPIGQLPGQSEEESESWPKSETRHAPQIAGSGRGKRSWDNQFRSLMHFDLVHVARISGRPTMCSVLAGDRASTSRLRC